MTIGLKFASCTSAIFMLSMASATAQAPRDITIGLASASLAVAPARLAQEMGIYEKHGLKAKFVTLDSANMATTALISKSFEVVVSGPGELVAAQGRGQKVVLITNLYGGFGATLVLPKGVADKLTVPSTAPASDRLKALDGLLIATNSATSAYTVALKAATEATKTNVRFTYMSQPAMIVALDSGAIQGFFTGAPFWAFPVVKGAGVAYLSGPKGDLPSNFVSASSGGLHAMRDFAEANPALMKKLVAVFDDFKKTLDERPADVRAALAKLYPDLDPAAMDLLLSSELLTAWRTKPPTAQDMAREIAFVKLSGAQLPQIDTLDPASLIFQPAP
jgi:ABC-type nitrate/sulfonate/bicarbonate transport system substrate-binding protein